MQRVKCIVTMYVLLINLKFAFAQNCPVDSYKLAVAADVMQMCGASGNLPCTVTQSTYHASTTYHRREYANDGSLTTITYTSADAQNVLGTSSNPQWLRVDLQKTFGISSVKLWSADRNAMRNGHVRVGNNPIWSDNAVAGTLNSDYPQTFTFSTILKGQYIFLNHPLPQTKHGFLGVREIEAFATCANCPAFSTGIRRTVPLAQPVAEREQHAEEQHGPGVDAERAPALALHQRGRVLRHAEEQHVFDVGRYVRGAVGHSE